MPKPRTQSGEKNLISQRLIELRKTHNMSQRDLAYKLQLAGYDMDKNVMWTSDVLAHFHQHTDVVRPDRKSVV